MRIKILLPVAFLVFSISPTSFGATYTITNSGFTFSPDEITISPGDTVIFSLGAIHNAVQVSEETWNNNGNTSNGGFSLPFGGGQVVLEDEGTYYYVCEPHANQGMKGIIHVSGTAVPTDEIYTDNTKNLKVYPNPVKDVMSVSFFVPSYAEVHIELFDVTGRIVQDLADKYYSPGKYTENYRLNNLQPGRYFILYRSGKQQVVQSVILIE
jgi:plastocyanin